MYATGFLQPVPGLPLRRMSMKQAHAATRLHSVPKLHNGVMYHKRQIVAAVRHELVQPHTRVLCLHAQYSSQVMIRIFYHISADR